MGVRKCHLLPSPPPHRSPVHTPAGCRHRALTMERVCTLLRFESSGPPRSSLTVSVAARSQRHTPAAESEGWGQGSGKSTQPGHQHSPPGRLPPRLPLTPRLPGWLGWTLCRAQIMPPGLLSDCRGAPRGRGAGAPGSLPGPPDAACCLAVLIAVSVTPRSAGESSMLAPSRRGPPPCASHPPLPSWHGGWEKAANPESAQCLWLCLNPARLITEHLIPAWPQRGRRAPGSCCLLHSAPGCRVLITSRQDAAPPRSALGPRLPDRKSVV